MRVIINDLVVAKCDLTGKENVECLRLQLDENTPPINCRPGEVIKLIRLKKTEQTPTSKGSMK